MTWIGQSEARLRSAQLQKKMNQMNQKPTGWRIGIKTTTDCIIKVKYCCKRHTPPRIQHWKLSKYSDKLTKPNPQRTEKLLQPVEERKIVRAINKGKGKLAKTCQVPYRFTQENSSSDESTPTFASIVTFVLQAQRQSKSTTPLAKRSTDKNATIARISLKGTIQPIRQHRIVQVQTCKTCHWKIKSQTWQR